MKKQNKGVFTPTRTIILRLEVNWEDYEDVVDELLVEDALGPMEVQEALGICLSVISGHELSLAYKNAIKQGFNETEYRPGGRSITKLGGLKHWITRYFGGNLHV